MPKLGDDRPGVETVPVRQSRWGQAVQIPPRGVIVVSWSEIDTARQCPMKHDLSYVERWTKGARHGGALARGTLWHAVMEAHYGVLASTQGATPGAKAAASDKARLAASKKAVSVFLFQAEKDAGTNQDARDDVALIAWMMDGYYRQYGIDPDWWIAGTEHAAQVRLPNERGGRSRFAIKLKIDLVVLTRGAFNRKDGKTNWLSWVVDHKSGKDLPKQKDFDFLDQFKLYTWSLRQMGRSVFGQMYNAARTFRSVKDQAGQATDPLDSRFSRTPISATDTELDRVAIEAYQTVSARYRQQRELDKIGGEPDRHTNEQTCSWRCDFTEPCLHGRKGGDMRDYLRSSGFRQDFSRH